MLKLFLSLLPIILFSKDLIDIIPKTIKHGSSFALILQSDSNLSESPIVTYKNNRYKMYPIKNHKEKYQVFIPVDYYANIQKENVQVSFYKNKKLIELNETIEIIDGDYKKNEIIQVPKSKVTLSPKNKTKTTNEYTKVFNSVYSVTTPKNLTNNNFFINPLDSNITSHYGNARIYNGKTKSYHTGTDFKAAVGTPIKASNDGIVSLVMDRFYLGKVIYIDHGYGAYSYYAHLSKTNVQKADKVQQGEIIGESGNSGRVTGPHLHYAFRLHNVTVNPLEFGKNYNEVVKKYY